MRTLVSFHAHPDDEAIACGGTMAKAAAAGHRVVLVLATRGEHGEVVDGFLQPREQLQERRVGEVQAAAQILGVARVEFLGYVDSGMIGTPENDAPDCFWQADVDQAAARLAAILTEEQADVLTVYDDHGGYGHPDHIQVHRVGVEAARLAGTPRVYESTIDRDEMRRLFAEVPGLAVEDLEPGEAPAEIDFETLGSPAELITTVVDVTGHLDQKRRAMAAHASQISETSFFLAMAPERFRAVWGREWFIRRGAPPGTEETDVFDGAG